jgi:hypothetical protein
MDKQTKTLHAVGALQPCGFKEISNMWFQLYNQNRDRKKWIAFDPRNPI